MRSIIVFVTLIISGFASADVISTKINQLGAANNTYAMVRLDTPASTKPPCAAEYQMMSFDKSTDHGKTMFSVALAALTAGKRLRIEYSSTSCGLNGNRALITRLDIYSN